jgi:hypothetical protein
VQIDITAAEARADLAQFMARAEAFAASYVAHH